MEIRMGLNLSSEKLMEKETYLKMAKAKEKD
jgi:hypothetical protein